MKAVPTTMRLQKVTSRSVGDRTYHKYVLTLPEDLIDSAGWEAGGEVTAKLRGHEVVLTYSAEAAGTRPRPKKIGSDYERFRDSIRQELASEPEGLTWSEIRKRLSLDQKVPNNVWVRRMERDIGLLRVKGPTGTRWRAK
jgi:hypothetical protein